MPKISSLKTILSFKRIERYLFLILLSLTSNISRFASFIRFRANWEIRKEERGAVVICHMTSTLTPLGKLNLKI
jgi:hypothetical protein